MSTTIVETVSRTSSDAEPVLMTPYVHDSLRRLSTKALDTPVTEHASFVTRSLSIPEDISAVRREKIRYRTVLATMFFSFFLLGLNDGSTGPLLPAYQTFYHVNFLTVSMIFISNCLGCLVSAFLNVFMSRRVAFSKILMLAMGFQIIAYSLMTARPPFPAMCVGFFINGMGMGLINSQGNAILSMLRSPTAMGIAHACYGTGALVAPLISTQFARLPRWSLHYSILLGTACFNLAACLFVLQGKGYDEILTEMGVSQREEIELQRPMSTTDRSTQDEEAVAPKKDGDSFSTLLKLPHVHVLAAFVFLYVGVEVTIGGWIVTFIINDRGGGPSSGYISSGFFGGLAAGRILLLPVTKRLGERWAMYLYLAMAMAFELVVWFTPSIIGNAVAVSLVGCALGPFYPIVMAQHSRLVPRNILSSTIGWIAGFGQSGSAVIPFMTGALANKYGIMALQPLIVSMMAAMAVLWLTLPIVSKKKD